MENNTVKIIVPAIEYTIAKYNAASNTYTDVTCIKSVGNKPECPEGFEIIKTRRIRLVTDMPVDTVLTYFKED